MFNMIVKISCVSLGLILLAVAIVIGSLINGDLIKLGLSFILLFCAVVLCLVGAYLPKGVIYRK